MTITDVKVPHFKEPNAFGGHCMPCCNWLHAQTFGWLIHFNFSCYSELKLNCIYNFTVVIYLKRESGNFVITRCFFFLI